MNLEIDSGISVSILIITASLWLIWKSISSRKTTEVKCSLPPGPRGLPIVGYLPFIREDLHTQFTELADKYGPICKLWLGNKLIVVISSPSLIKEIVRDNDTIFSNRADSVATRIITSNASDISWCPYGPEWRDRRKLFVHEMLSNDSLEASNKLRKDEVRKAIRLVYSKIGTPIEICELAFIIDLNVMMSMVWGTTVQGEDRDKVEAAFLPLFESIMDLLGKPNISDFFPILARFDIQRVAKESTILMKRVRCIIEEIIDDRMKRYSSDNGEQVTKGQGRTDFLQMIVELQDKGDVKVSLTKTNIIAILFNIIVAGTDTSSTTVEWVLAELLNNPDIMEKVQKELSEVVGVTNIVEELHIQKLVYLDAVIKETIRLHPIGPFLTPRTPSKTCTVGGYTIPKDTGIYINVWSVQRDPLVFDNPLEFRPGRFISNTDNWDYRGNNFNYIPFGSGRRVCPGIPLADRMVMYILASLLHSFDWKLPKGTEKLDMSDKYGIVLRKRTPLCAIPVPRLSDSHLYS